MSVGALSYICVTSRTLLRRFEADGARCGVPTHWHARIGDRFAGAELFMGQQTYRDVMPEPPRALSTAEDTAASEP